MWADRPGSTRIEGLPRDGQPRTAERDGGGYVVTMRAEARPSWREHAERSGHRRDDNQEHEGWKETEHQGEGEPYGRAAGFGLGTEPCPAAKRLGGRRSPPFRGVERGRRGSELVEARPLAHRTERGGWRPPHVELGRRTSELTPQGGRATLRDPHERPIRVETGQQAGAEQVDDRGSCGGTLGPQLRRRSPGRRSPDEQNATARGERDQARTAPDQQGDPDRCHRSGDPDSDDPATTTHRPRPGGDLRPRRFLTVVRRPVGQGWPLELRGCQRRARWERRGSSR